MQALYNLSRFAAHEILVKFLRKTLQKVTASQSDCYMAGFRIIRK